jgi:hypothetical protein
MVNRTDDPTDDGEFGGMEIPSDEADTMTAQPLPCKSSSDPLSLKI